MNESKGAHNGTAVVVGASLSGLMTGISLAREGIRVTILDKVAEDRPGGSGLRVNGARFGESGTEKLLKTLASGGKTGVQLWETIESRLREEAKRNPGIALHYHARVFSVGQDEYSARAVTDEGETYSGDVLIGADGHGSRVRREVDPENPHAAYVGYMGWIASIDEEELPASLRPGRVSSGAEMFDSHNGFKFGSVIQRGDGSGRQRIGCTWYDNTQSAMLRRTGCVDGTVVRHSINGPDIPEETMEELAEQASRDFPEPWRTAALHSIETRTLIGIPIKEYVPDKLTSGRMALVGDAAHVPAPVTASGFNESLQDAVVLGKCAAKGLHGEAAVQVLAKYESLRLRTMREMVRSGQFYSQTFGRR